MNTYFFTFEGLDGSGKTTAMEQVAKKLTNDGYDIMCTREPGGIEISERIREIVLHPQYTTMDSRTEALLYAAARRQHLVEKVIPALKNNKIVLCDRFVDSSLAYQGVSRGLGFDEVLAINEFAIEGIFPSLTIYIDIPPEVGLARLAKNQKKSMDRLDLEELSFHEKVQEGYEHVMNRFKNRIHVVDGTKSVEEVVLSSYAIITNYLDENK